MKRVRWPILIALLAALFVAVAWQRAKNDMPIEFLDGAPKVSYISRQALEAKPKIDFKIFGKRIRYPEPIEDVMLPLDMDTGPGYLDVRGTPVSQWDVWFEDADGSRIMGSTVFFNAPIAAVAPRFSSLSGYSPRDTRIFLGGFLPGIPYATDGKYREATLACGKERYRVRLPASSQFGPSQRRETSASFGRWKMVIRPRPWKYTTAFFDVDVRIDGPQAIFLYPDRLQLNATLGIARTGVSQTQSIRYLPGPLVSRAEIIRVSEETVDLVVDSPGVGRNSLVLTTGEPVFNWKSGIPWDNKSIVALKCLNILAFHSSGFSEVDSKQKLDTLKDGDRVKGTIYRVLERFRVDIPVDIPHYSQSRSCGIGNVPILKGCGPSFPSLP